MNSLSLILGKFMAYLYLTNGLSVFAQKEIKHEKLHSENTTKCEVIILEDLSTNCFCGVKQWIYVSITIQYVDFYPDAFHLMYIILIAFGLPAFITITIYLVYNSELTGLNYYSVCDMDRALPNFTHELF